jgi:hypothetical protein
MKIILSLIFQVLNFIFMQTAMLKLSFTLAIFSLSLSSFAQDFIVTVQGDTLKGEVKPLTYGTEKKIQLTEPGKKKVIYPFFKVKAFSVGGGLFQPVKGPDGYVFMKLLKSGYLSLYSFQHPNQTLYDGLYLLKKDGTGIEVPNLTFKKGMRNFLDDCPAVADKIDSDVLNKRDLNQIVDEYNACIDSRSSRTETAVAANRPLPQPVKTSSAWEALENKVKAQPDFAEKENALEMIGEIKNKMAASQRIPNFLIEGLKSSLSAETFKTELENALKEIE